MPDSKDPKITIDSSEIHYKAHIRYDLIFMYCRNCKAIMYRGTQCQKCGAWCQ